MRLILYETLALIGLGDDEKCREVIKHLIEPMAETNSVQALQEEASADKRDGKGISQHHLNITSLRVINEKLVLEYPPDTEDDDVRELNVREANTVSKELEAILAYCLDGTKYEMRSLSVQDCMLDRKELAFRVAQDWSRAATYIEKRYRLEKIC